MYPIESQTFTIIDLLKKIKHIFYITIKRSKKKRLIKKQFSFAKSFLEDGEYLIDITCNYVFKDDFLTKTILKKLSGIEPLKAIENKIFRSLIYFFSGLKLFVKTNNKTKDSFQLNGTFLLMSNKQKGEENYGGYKIFDFYNKKILTRHVSQSNYYKNIKNYKTFNSHFRIPSITHYCSANYVTMEEMVDFIPRNKLKERNFDKIVDYIFNSYCDYFEMRVKASQYNTAKAADFLTDYQLNLNSDAVFITNKLKKYIERNSLNRNIPILLQHGDLSLSNILLAKNKKCYIIDWEHANSYSFLYDIMWAWQNEAINRNNYYFLKEYYSGKYDKNLQRIFNIFNLSYDDNLRHVYLNIVIAELLYKRIYTQGSTLANWFINERIQPLILKIENDYLFKI